VPDVSICHPAKMRHITLLRISSPTVPSLPDHSPIAIIAPSQRKPLRNDDFLYQKLPLYLEILHLLSLIFHLIREFAKLYPIIFINLI